MGITSFLFVTALFLKGLTHDALLEAGIFLVSVNCLLKLGAINELWC